MDHSIYNPTELLFIDIETVCCCPSYAQLDKRLQAQWDRKASYIDATVSSEDLYFQKGAIYAEFGKIIVIGAGILYYNTDKKLSLKLKAFSGHDEAALLKEFKDLVEKFPADKLRLVAHNGREFDYPYLCRRLLVNGIKVPDALNLSGKKPWEIKHLDTLEYWKFGDRKNFTSLELLAALFNIPGSKDDMDGSMVTTTYYVDNALDKIAQYCLKDVEVTAQLFLRMNQLDLISQENIIYS
jgi:3'-5' exonuclease